jgi:flagellum-specific peptidoglycan hydrolase FlgJ
MIHHQNPSLNLLFQQVHINNTHKNKPMLKQEFINNYWDAAKEACAGTPIFPILALAEAAIESAWGISYLTSEANNFFGMKSTESWEASGGKFVVKPTHEVVDGETITVQAKFRSYDTPADCFRNYVHFVTQPGYVALGVTEATTPEDQIKCIAQKYATDPEYSAKVTATMHGLRQLLPA